MTTKNRNTEAHARYCRERWRAANALKHPRPSIDESLAAIEEAARELPIDTGKGVDMRLVVTPSDLSRALGRKHDAVARWARTGLIPKAPWRLAHKTGRRMVYPLHVAQSLALIVGEHQQEVSYYGPRHGETRQRLFAAAKGPLV